MWSSEVHCGPLRCLVLPQEQCSQLKKDISKPNTRRRTKTSETFCYTVVPCIMYDDDGGEIAYFSVR